MATEQNFSITKGRTGTIIATITGVASWTGINARLVASRDYEGTPAIDLDGEIDEVNNQITFTYTFSDTKDLDYTSYVYEIIIYKDDKSYIKRALYGTISINRSVVIDPTS